MPQLWKTGRPAAPTPGSATNQPTKGFLICPPLVLGNGEPSNGLFPSSPPSSPTGHQHPPKYDQLLNELRRAQERRGRLQTGGQTDAVPTGTAVVQPATLFKSPLQAEVRRTLRSPEPPSGTYVNQYNSSAGLGCSRIDPVDSKSQRIPNKTVPKKVRFLEDGTGNLHTSVFGGSAESVGSLLDSHQELNQSVGSGTDDIDSLISSLISYSDASDCRSIADPIKATNGTTQKNPSEHVDLRELRIPAFALVANNNSTDPEQQMEKATLHQTRSGVLDNFLDIFRCAEVVDQRQTVVHLEPDDPNSVDSGSVLSELDFEETSSTITDIDSNKTFSLHSPENSIDHRIDDWSQVSDLLERSLQEIRQMEEDTNKAQQEKPPAAEVSKREPLYELIGWKRNPPPVQLDLRGSKPFPLPAAPARQPSPPPPPEPVKADPDVWIPRQDWVPPAAVAPPPAVRHSDKVWIRRPTFSVANNSQNNQNPVIRKPQSVEDNPIYGRLWETSSSPNTSSRSSSCSADAEEKPPTSNEADLTAIRSMARKARLEHWRLAGMSGTTSTEEETGQTNALEQTSSASSSPAYLSSLPLFNHRVKNGIQLTWPPPPLPHSPCPSSATATPVTPTLPPLPTLEVPQPVHNGHSPKCFGHQRVFQWPVPALKLSKSPPVQQRNGSNGSSVPNAAVDRREIKPWRPAKPANLEDAQDWYWTEEFPLAAGLEPGTGNMSAWFHGAISRWEAERRLTNQPTGAFLARLTERLWGYAISVRNPSGSVSHFLIDAGEKRSHKKYTLLGSTDPPHKSLRELIQYYGKHALTPDGSEKLLFPCPQESSVAFPPTINGCTSSRLIKST